MPNASRASDQKDSTPQIRQEAAALRDFNAAHVRVVNSGHSQNLGERGNGGFRDFLAPLLDEVTAVWNLERRGTSAYLLAQCRHHRRAPDPGFPPAGPGPLPPPLLSPP